jgi:hypothetical protein
LDESGTDATRCARDQHALARPDAGAIEHVLARQIGAAEGRQLDVGHTRAHDMGVLGRRREVLGIAAVATVADIVDVGQAVVGAVVEAEIQHDALADAARRHALADCDDAADAVGALTAREGEGRGGAAPPGGHGVGIVVGAVGAEPHPDVRIVHAAGRHLDQHLAGRGPRHRHICAVDELVQAAMPGQQHRMHGRGNSIRWHWPRLLGARDGSGQGGARP